MKLTVSFLLLFFVMVHVGWAQSAAPVSPEQRRKLIDQKVRLLEMLINSPAAKAGAAGRDDESNQLLEKGRRSFEDAKHAIADGRLDDASRLLDETLKSTSAASRKISPDGSGLSESALRKSLADKQEQVMTYRAAVVDMTRDSKLGLQARQLLLQIDVLLGESKQLTDGARLSEANKKMAAAYKLAVEEIARLRAGQEVVMSLTFETPADEYAYEVKRFASNLTMVDMMIGEGRADGSKRALVDGFVAEGQRLRTVAEGEAGARRHKEAVAIMEQASVQLTRALQAMGLAVF
jgi:hypothetical protein